MGVYVFNFILVIFIGYNASNHWLFVPAQHRLLLALKPNTASSGVLGVVVKKGLLTADKT